MRRHGSTTRLILPVFFCLCAALAATPLLKAESPEAGGRTQETPSSGGGTLAFSDPRLKATGRDWVAFEAPDKFALMRTFFSFYGLSETTYDIGRAVELLDLMYMSRADDLTDGVEKKAARTIVERDALLNFPVHLNFMYILNDKESTYGVRYFLREGVVPEQGEGESGPLRRVPDRV